MIFSGTNGSSSAFWGLVNLNPPNNAQTIALVDIKTQSESVHFCIISLCLPRCTLPCMPIDLCSSLQCVLSF